MATRRIRDPHYGMAVTDATGTFMLVSRRTPVSEARGDERYVWWAYRIDAGIPFNSPDRSYLLLLDPDQFGEVV